MIGRLGALVDRAEAARRLSRALHGCRQAVADAAAGLRWNPRVYFEEGDEPMICGIGWVSELIGVAGGIDVFAERARCGSAADRIVDAGAVLVARPCGDRARPAPAVRPHPAAHRCCTDDTVMRDER